MLPPSELDRYVKTVTHAVGLAEKGEPRAGYAALLAGVERALEMTEPWAGELAERYRQALDRFTDQWRILP